MIQNICPSIPPCVGWPIVGVLVIFTIVFLVIGIRKKGVHKSLIITPHAWAIGLSGMTGYPKEPNGTCWFRLEFYTNDIDKPIDTLDLIVDGKPIPANHWHAKIATSFTEYFNITDWKQKHIIHVDLQARIKGDVPSLVRIMPIDFDIEPGGFPRYL